MTPLILIPYYAAVNRWIGAGYYQGKNIGRVLFALPIAGTYYPALPLMTHPERLYLAMVAAFLWVYFMRNLPHGKHYTLGYGALSSGHVIDFFYMAGKGAMIFAPLALISPAAFFIGALGWPCAYIAGWNLARGDAATIRAEWIGGVIAGVAVWMATT